MMNYVVTSRDVEEILIKLSSDKVKSRDEGVKLLNTWLKGGQSAMFCKYVSKKTATSKSGRYSGTETWPSLVDLMIDCVSKEIDMSKKKRVPRLIYAKTMRIVVQRAEDSRPYGNVIPLIKVAKPLFKHIPEVLIKVKTFQSEYAVMLRHLLAVRDYQFQIKKQDYCDLVCKFIVQINESYGKEDSSRSASTSEECFRWMLTLHSLLEHPPKDIPSRIRTTVVNFFTEIFQKTMGEALRIQRKLLKCLNAFLLKDGPNLGDMSLSIHNSVKKFVFSKWPYGVLAEAETKAVFILYARLQLHLRRGNEDEKESADGDEDNALLIEDLMKIIGRELDQCSIPSIVASRSDIAKDDNIRSLTSSHQSLLELAAFVVYRACAGVKKELLALKRARRQNVTEYLKDQLTSGTWSWHAVLCHLCINYKSHISKDFFMYWFDGICSSLESILSDAAKGHSYGGFLWTLRSLHQLFLLMLLPPVASTGKCSPKFLTVSNKFVRDWQTIWSCLIHGFPLFSNFPSVADAAFRLLGDMVSNDILVVTEVPRSMWDLQCFRDISSLSALYFIACYFSRKGSQGDLRDNLHLRQSILRGVMSTFTRKDFLKLDEHIVILFPAAIYAVCVGGSGVLNYYRGLFSSYWNLDGAGMASDLYEAKDKRKAFKEISENFRPVMHYFFLERFLHPADWFENRLAYTRSVAASSMVGYIVGLGDRHSMNILVDQATAEVVHIDLGVAFEQGLMLKTPERVPFRLTRDIVDEMGVTGVEGVFRRCCEETLALMRANKEALLTIIEVFIHDPLYKWALSPLKALQRQKETEDDLEINWEDSQDEDEGNKDAARALMRVKQKLDGFEDGELRSVHGQVHQLIQDATDPERLCLMFPGWGAWM